MCENNDSIVMEVGIYKGKQNLKICERVDQCPCKPKVWNLHEYGPSLPEKQKSKENKKNFKCSIP